MSRIALFLLTNIAIMAVVTVVMGLLGISGSNLDAQGNFQYADMLISCALFGFGGAFISLLMSKKIAKWSTRAQVITQPQNDTERWLIRTVEQQARMANIGMPEVAIFDSASPNAFATGASKNASLVAVSTGLLRSMNQDQVEAVLAHEVSHVANGDMVTLTLIQGVVNTFVFFLSRLLGTIIDKAVFKSDRGQGPGYFITVIVLQVVLGFLASAIVMWFSRQREYRADAGGAKLAGRNKMISALQALQNKPTNDLPEQMAAFGISPRASKWGSLFMSHPPLEERIRALQNAT